MSGVGELASQLGRALAAFGYVPGQAEAMDGAEATVFAAPRGTGRTLCVVAAMPDDLAGANEAAGFVAHLRKAMSTRYRGLPKPGRLATYTVLLAGHDLCSRLRAHTNRLIDAGRWHVNVMLGTVLVDVEEFRLHANTTWGLVETADQFEHIRRTVDDWCRGHRKPRRSVLSGSRCRHVA